MPLPSMLTAAVGGGVGNLELRMVFHCSCSCCCCCRSHRLYYSSASPALPGAFTRSSSNCFTNYSSHSSPTFPISNAKTSPTCVEVSARSEQQNRGCHNHLFHPAAPPAAAHASACKCMQVQLQHRVRTVLAAAHALWVRRSLIATGLRSKAPRNGGGPLQRHVVQRNLQTRAGHSCV